MEIWAALPVDPQGRGDWSGLKNFVLFTVLPFMSGVPGTAQRNVQLTQVLVLVAEASLLMRAAAAADLTWRLGGACTVLC